MKKTKFLMPIIGIGTLVTTTVPTMTSCKHNTDKQALCFTDIKDDNHESIVSAKWYGQDNVPNIKYSCDSENWNNWTFTYNEIEKCYISNEIIINSNDNNSKNDKIFFWNTQNILSYFDNYFNFVLEGKIKVSGNCNSMINYGQLTDYCFYNLFNNNDAIVDCSQLLLPCTTLAESCYSFMFCGCTSLVKPPKLAATTLTHYCYGYMFANCTSLITAPELPATALADLCYYCMFAGCTSLTNVPKLPSANLAESSYDGMFMSCISLTQAPELPATRLANNCYYSMFSGCTSLTIAPKLPATTLAVGCYSEMFCDCTSLVQPPKLLATKLVDYCYNWMFYGCTSLKVNENEAGTKIFTCPNTDGLVDPITDMFTDTSGTFRSTPTDGNTYNWYTE